MVKVTGKSKSPIPAKPHADSFDGLNVGDLISVRGEPGRFKVMRIVVDDEASPTECRWIDAFGGDGYPAKGENIYVGWRSFPLDKIVRSSSGSAQRVESGRRDPGLIAELHDELARAGTSSRPAPEDPKANKSLRERYYTAARRLGVKVRVKQIGDMIVAKVKEEAA